MVCAEVCTLSTHAREYPRGSHIPEHAHGSNQLIYASRGVMEVASGQSLWKIPPHFGLWIRARTAHQIRMSECVSMRTLYLRPSVVNLPPLCAVLHVGPLLRELIIEIVRIGQLRIRNRIECALHDLLIAELERASPVPTALLLPTDQRALAVAQNVIANPARSISLKLMCASAGVTELIPDPHETPRPIRIMSRIGPMARTIENRSAVSDYRAKVGRNLCVQTTSL